MSKAMSKSMLICVGMFLGHIAASDAQLVPGNSELLFPHGRGPLPKSPVKKPSRSIADTAEEYWIANQCVYPPKAFFSLFRDACDVRLKAETFYSGICQAFFNSSKSLCKLEEASEDELQTMLSINELQSTIEDDELCDTLADMKQKSPNLFPKAEDFSEKEKWFQSISSLIFSPETCSNACGMDKLHPICFGYMLNYNYIGSLLSAIADFNTGEEVKKTDDKEATEENMEENPPVEEVKEANNRDQEMLKFEPVKSNLTLYEPNPKLSGVKASPAEHYEDDFVYEGKGERSDALFPDILEHNSDELSDILDLNNNEDDKELAPNDYALDPNFTIEDLPEINNDFFFQEDDLPINPYHKVARPRLRGYVREKLDRSEEFPMLAVVLAVSGLLAVVCFFVLFGVRKKIGIYMKYVRQNRRNNWNYERVFAVQPDDDDYYE